MNGTKKFFHPALLPARNADDAALLLSSMFTAKGGYFVATLNFELLARAAAFPSFAKLLRDADGRVCDGIGGQLLLKWRQTDKLVPRIPGIDLGYALLRLAAREDIPTFLLGGKPGVAERASRQLSESLPHLRIVGTAHGFFKKCDLPALRGKIRTSGAALVIVCLGSPCQEEWIAANRRYLPNVRLFLPLGGSLDVWAGEVRRAPRIWQKAGLEWLWRAFPAPNRQKRLWTAGLQLLHAYCQNANLFPKIRNFVSN